MFIDHLVLNRARAGGNSRTPLGVESFAENLIVALMGATMPFLSLSGSGPGPAAREQHGQAGGDHYQGEHAEQH